MAYVGYIIKYYNYVLRIFYSPLYMPETDDEFQNYCST